MDPETTLGAGSPVVGMVHLPALPGAPGYDGDRAGLRERARRDARALAGGGVDAVMVENLGDVPYYPEDVPTHVVADLTVVAADLRRTVDVPVGVNALRNDAPAALSVAAAVGGRFVRTNVHTGVRVTDQGVVAGRAHETMRLRERLDADVAVLADVGVKHSGPLGDRPFEARLRDAVERGLADGVVVSGEATAREPAADRLDAAAGACADLGVPLLVGSGVTPETVADALAVADGVVVGTALKENGVTTNPVDPDRVAALVRAAGEG